MAEMVIFRPDVNPLTGQVLIEFRILVKCVGCGVVPLVPQLCVSRIEQDRPAQKVQQWLMEGLHSNVIEDLVIERLNWLHADLSLRQFDASRKAAQWYTGGETGVMMSSIGVEVEQAQLDVSVPDHAGTEYKSVLRNLHEWLSPSSYFEIGTNSGDSLSIASCAAIAVDPDFTLGTRDIVGKKPFCALYQMPSDTFFRRHDPTRIFDGPIDLAFLDGMHYCEYLLRDFANTERHCRPNSIIALHDCVPVELAIAGRTHAEPVHEHHSTWWAGDVWRTLLTLRKHRPDLAFTVLDASPTGLVLITNLDPCSTVLTDGYVAIVREMMSLSLEEISLEGLFSAVNLESTSVIATRERAAQRFWL